MRAGYRDIARRLDDAEDNFLDTVQDILGCTRDDAWIVLDRYRKDKILKRDAVGGRYRVKHGAFMDPEVMLRAISEAKKMRPNRKAVPLDPEVVDAIVGFFSQEATSGKKRFTKKKFGTIEDVKGKKKDLFLQLDRVPDGKVIYNVPVLGGSYRPSTGLLKVKIHLPTLWDLGEEDPKKAVDKMMKQIRQVVTHELTHALDVIDTRKVRKAYEGRGKSRTIQDDYLNSPHEVRAYAREIADEVADRTRGRSLSNISGKELQKLIEQSSSDMGLHYSRMSEESKRRINEIVHGQLLAREPAYTSQMLPSQQHRIRKQAEAAQRVQSRPKSKARQKAGRRSAEAKSERLDQLIFDVEGYDPTLVPLAKKWNYKIPARPDGMSRFEMFLQMVEADPDAAMLLAEEEATAYVKKMSKEQWEEPELQWYTPGEYEDDPFSYLDEFSEREEEMTPQELESFALYLEDVLSNREVEMLRRVIGREGMSDRELTCFFRRARTKLKKNGSIWL